MILSEPRSPIRTEDDRSAFFERLASAEIGALLKVQFAQQVAFGIHTAYREGLLEMLYACSEASRTDAEIEDTFSAVAGAELPFLVTADHDYITGSALDFHLIKATPSTGESLPDSFVSVGDHQDGEVSHVHPPFQQEQAELILQHATELAEAGLDPRQIYSLVSWSPV